MIQREKYPPGYSRLCNIDMAIVPKARPRVHLSEVKELLVLSSIRGDPEDLPPTHLDAHMPAKYKKCIRQIGFLLNAHFGSDRRWPKDASYGLDVEVTVHSSMEGDVDNLLGAFMDAANGIVWLDDRQVASATVRKLLVPRSDPKRATMRVIILEPTGFEPKRRRERKHG